MLAVSLSAPRTGFDEGAYFRTALAALRDIPSVDRASVTQYQPFGTSVERDRFTHDGRSYTLYVNRSDADYFSTAGLRILRGRAFTGEEVAREAPVALISDSVARMFFAGTDPVGRSLAGLSPEAPQAPAMIVGVVADAIVGRLRTHRYGTIYRPSVRNVRILPASSFGPRIRASPHAPLKMSFDGLTSGTAYDDDRSE